MAEIEVRPHWASPPGETIRSVLHAKGITLDAFRSEVGLDESQTAGLLSGLLPVTTTLARDIAKFVGSTAHFWLQRQKQYEISLQELAAAEPELLAWGESFPLKKMIDSGWLPRPYSKREAAFELLDFFDIEDVAEWRERYPIRLGLTKFRTSPTLQNDTSTTLAWIRRGEILAEKIECEEWNREGFLGCLEGVKSLSKISDPIEFVPKLQAICAKYGVAVVVARSIPGCAASGATAMLGEKKALLLISARFLSDDQFWFTFFHEAGHLVLHEGEVHVESEETSTSQQEAEANQFAEKIILAPAGKSALLKMHVTPYSIARLARQCDVSPGLVVGQLQFSERISPKLFNKFKTRYKAAQFTL